ncbi:hypothetical protein Tco_0806609, partial [Tanacetum coccineum]
RQANVALDHPDVRGVDATWRHLSREKQWEKLMAWYRGRRYFDGHVDIFDMVDINLFSVVALNMMVVQLGYKGKSEPMYYNYLRPLTSLDEGLYALACEEDARCMAILVRSFKLIRVYIEHGVTAVDSYRRPPPRVRATIKYITNEHGSSASIENRSEKMLLLTWHDSSAPTKEPVCDSITPMSLPQHDSNTPCKDSVCESVTPRRVNTQDHVLPRIQSQFSNINLSFVSQQPTANQVIDDVMRQLSFEKTELDGEAGFGDVAGSGVDSSGLSHDECFKVDDLDLNLNEPVDLNVSQTKTQSKLIVSEEPNVGRTQEPIVEEVIVKDYVSSEEDVEQGNGQEDESAPSDVQFFYDVEGIDSAYETKYDVHSSEDAGTYDDDFLVDKENEIVESDVDVHFFGISMDVPFDNISVTNLVPDDVLEGEDMDIINLDGFNRDPRIDYETSNYRRRKLVALSREIEGVMNISGQWKYSFYTGQKFTTTKEAKYRVYLHSIESIRNLKLYKNDSVKVRARCVGKVPVFTMSQDYVVELQSTNSNTTVKIAVERDTDPSFPTRGWCGQAYKNLLWRSASATSVKEFEKCMLELKKMNPKAHEWNWKLTGIPCKHDVVACWNMALNDQATSPPEACVNLYYWLTTWKETYSYKVEPINGTNYLEKSTCPITLLPPNNHVQVVQVLVLEVKVHPILDGQREEYKQNN